MTRGRGSGMSFCVIAHTCVASTVARLSDQFDQSDRSTHLCSVLTTLLRTSPYPSVPIRTARRCFWRRLALRASVAPRALLRGCRGGQRHYRVRRQRVRAGPITKRTRTSTPINSSCKERENALFCRNRRARLSPRLRERGRRKKTGRHPQRVPPRKERHAKFRGQNCISRQSASCSSPHGFGQSSASFARGSAPAANSSVASRAPTAKCAGVTP